MIRTERLEASTARIATDEDARLLADRHGVELARRSDGTVLAVLRDTWRLRSRQREVSELVLAALPAGSD